MPKIYIENKNALVLGGAGFIGSHLCEYLVNLGHNVICVDNFISSNVENIRAMLEYPNFVFLRHDITEDLDYINQPGLKKFKVEVQGFQEIYNLACPTAPKDFTKFPVETAVANSVGVVKSLELARKHKARYLLASSSAVYGQPPQDDSLISEEYYGLLDHLDRRACYNEGKRFAETLVMTYRDTYKLNTSIARIFSTYGPRMLGQAGRHVPDFIRAAVNGQDLEIAGDENSRSTFCYVKDIVEGLIALMDSEVSEPINLGSDNSYTFVEVAQKVIDLTHAESKIKFIPNYKYILKRAIPDISKAKEELNWFPLVSIDDGLRAAIDYYKATAFLHEPRVDNKEE